MNDGALDTMDADEMLGGLGADIEALIASGELAADEAADMLAWLGSPAGE